MTDRELVKKVLAGNSSAFKTVISNTQGLVIQITYKMIRNAEDRKDILQEVYLKVYDKLAGFKFNSKLSTWIGSITYNTCLNFLEKKRIPVLNVVDDEGNESWETIVSSDTRVESNNTEYDLFKKERSQILEKEIDKLPPLYKTILTLYHQKELSYKEIAVITKLPEGTLKNYLYRARKQLKENLLHNYKKEEL